MESRPRAQGRRCFPPTRICETRRLRRRGRIPAPASSGYMGICEWVRRRLDAGNRRRVVGSAAGHRGIDAGGSLGGPEAGITTPQRMPTSDDIARYVSTKQSPLTPRTDVSIQLRRCTFVLQPLRAACDGWCGVEPPAVGSGLLRRPMMGAMWTMWTMWTMWMRRQRIDGGYRNHWGSCITGGVLLYLPGPSMSGRGPAGSHTIPRKTKEPRDL